MSLEEVERFPDQEGPSRDLVETSATLAAAPGTEPKRSLSPPPAVWNGIVAYGPDEFALAQAQTRTPLPNRAAGDCAALPAIITCAALLALAATALPGFKLQCVLSCCCTAVRLP